MGKERLEQALVAGSPDLGLTELFRLQTEFEGWDLAAHVNLTTQNTLKFLTISSLSSHFDLRQSFLLLLAARFHDCGKTALEPKALRSDGCSWEKMAQHPQLGAELFSSATAKLELPIIISELNLELKAADLELVAQLIRYHHFPTALKLNHGKNYPDPTQDVIWQNPEFIRLNLVLSALDIISAFFDKAHHPPSRLLKDYLNQDLPPERVLPSQLVEFRGQLIANLTGFQQLYNPHSVYG